MSIYIGDKEIKNLFAGGITEKDYSAVQGPAPDGFHVPSIEEWQGVNTIMRGLGLTTGDNWRINLHMPLAGCRDWGDSLVSQQGSQGHYWTYSTASDNAFYLYLYSSYVGVNSSERRGLGDSIRAFKDNFVTPTSSWTVINGTLGSAGIFWNQTDGIISITSNGNTGYTIMDKNLGATTVYNDGASLTQANMGYMYQWGNNYGFPSTGNVTTSSTPVNTQNYGPGNYYNGSSFIKTSSNYRYDWSSVRNDNLRGGVTGIIDRPKEAKEVYLGDAKVRPSIQPVSKTFSYTGGDQTWIVPYTQDYIITCKGAGSNTSAGGLGQGTITLTKGTVLKIMVGQSGSSTSSGTYGFGGTSNYSSNRSGGGLSGVFTGSEAITATSSSRALVIGGGAGGGQSSSRAGGAGGGETGATGGGSNYGTAGGGGTQTGRNTGGNVGANQFNGGNGSGTYGWGGGGGRWGGNGSIGDGSGDDDKGAGGGSGYVISTASNRVLTQGGGSASGNHGSVTIVSVNQ